MAGHPKTALMKNMMAISLLLALTACGSGIEEWNPESDPETEAIQKRQQDAARKVTPKMVADYYAPIISAKKEGISENANTSSDIGNEVVSEAQTGSQNNDANQKAIETIVAERRKKMIEATRKAEARNAQMRLSQMRREETKEKGKSSEADITLPAPER